MIISAITEDDSRNVKLPEWLENELPEIPAPLVVDFTDEAVEFLEISEVLSPSEFEHKSLIDEYSFDEIEGINEYNANEDSDEDSDSDDDELPEVDNAKKVHREKLQLIANSALFCIRSFDGSEDETNLTLEEAYEKARTGDRSERNSKFSDRLSEFFDRGMGKSSIFVPMTNGGSRMFILIPQDSRRSSLEYNYVMFQKYAEAYLKNPTDFELAYTFVDHHPAFWIKEYLPKDLAHDAETPKTFDWKTGSHAMSLWCVPSFNNGKTTWMMEAGQHTPDYRSHYHDFNLDVYAETVEEAFIIMAEKLNKFFNLDGTNREETEDEPSELRDMLTDRMASWEESLLKSEEEAKEIQKDESYQKLKDDLEEFEK